MSLDVYLLSKTKIKRPNTSGIFIREGGKTIEITEKEWDERFPGRAPVRFTGQDDETDELFSANITHNMGDMADKAGIYYALWRPEERGWKVAKDITKVLRGGIKELKDRPEYFKSFNPDNGWGDYEGLLQFAESYLEACNKYPDAEIRVSR